MGQNVYGTLGLGTSGGGAGKSSPNQVGSLTTWATASGGGNSSFAIKTDGTLWSWGRNIQGDLGLGVYVAYSTMYSSPKQVGALTNWSQTDGQGARLAIKTNGTLWSWGSNGYGAQGNNSTASRSSPGQVGALTNWSMVSNYQSNTAAVKTDGTLWTWGQGTYGGLGLGNATNYSSPKQVGALTSWSKISSGIQRGAAIKTDGTLWAWGQNDLGQLGLGDVTNRSSPVQVGVLTTWGELGPSAAGFALVIKS